MRLVRKTIIYIFIFNLFVMVEVIRDFYYRGIEIPRLQFRLKEIQHSYFEQKLDHFKATDQRTWSQRFWVNTTHYEKGGPAFLFISGEAPASTYWMSFGAWHIYARDVKAMLFMLEHRYYGGSRPTKYEKYTPINDTSTDNLAFLSSTQALADLSHFIGAMKKRFSFTEDTKWIAIGGSYAGSLAVWLRMKYPHLIYGVVSSSAPLLAKLNFPEFLQTIAKIISLYDQKCERHITRAFKELDVMARNKYGQRILTDRLQLCENFTSNPNNIAFLHQSLVNTIANLVQNDKGFKNTSDIHSIKGICDRITNSSLWKNKTTSIRRFMEINRMIFNIIEGVHCLPSDYYSYIKEAFQTSDWDISSIYGKLWLYQTCTEFGFFQTSSKRGNMFGRFLTLEYLMRTCEDAFGSKFNARLISSNVNRTNIMYGALNNNVDRIIYVHGSADPWHSLGIYNTTDGRKSKCKVVFIEGTSHCADMFEPSTDDNCHLKKARDIIKKEINAWIFQN